MKTNVTKIKKERTLVEAGATVKFGLDVHAEQITVRRQIDGRVAQPAQQMSWPKTIAWAGAHVKAGAKVYSCYEAGPCGYGLHRQLTQMGVTNFVIAPQLWDRSGRRVKTDQCSDARITALTGRLPESAILNFSIRSGRREVSMVFVGPREFVRPLGRLESGDPSITALQIGAWHDFTGSFQRNPRLTSKAVYSSERFPAPLPPASWHLNSLSYLRLRRTRPSASPRPIIPVFIAVRIRRGFNRLRLPSR